MSEIEIDMSGLVETAMGMVVDRLAGLSTEMAALVSRHVSEAITATAFDLAHEVVDQIEDQMRSARTTKATLRVVS